MVSKKLISEKDLSFVLEELKSAEDVVVSDLILQQHMMSDKDLLCFLSDEFKCGVLDPNQLTIDKDMIKLIPPDFAFKRMVVPIAKREKLLTVAMEHPSDLRLIDDLKAVTGLRIQPVLALQRQLRIAVAQYYPSGSAKKMPKAEEMIDELVRIVQESKRHEDNGSETMTLLKQAQETPIIKIANLLILDAVRRKASDLFIEPWEKSIRVRCRVDGLLEEVPSPPKNMGLALVSRFKVMSHLNIAERRIPQDGRFQVKVQGREVDLRVSVMPTTHGEKVCLRILDKQTETQFLEKLGFTADELTQIKECSHQPHGMILVTGPTGSGKTTTLYSILKYVDSPEKNITTVEDPVEYETDGINQVNVRDAIGLTFPVVLRSILRQDPDIILVGEIRDLVTMDIGIKAALTGHLVLSTLHTNDTAGSIVRMQNMGIEPFLIASSVLMVSAQRLLRRLCPHCKAEYEEESDILAKLHLKGKGQTTFYRPVGCNQCRSTGYMGRTVITEILRLTPELKAFVMKNASGDEIKRCARRQGTRTLRESGVAKALGGETSLSEVFRLTAEDQNMERET
ncbi:MAG: hypothetical protein A3J52_00215 [Omnitrophica bacterium RIFCSPHIGHO2_02_FULL_49_9]|nr:MAG: hypothetical protein A3J52_00215 [Omnitrophica bacterium RIFCSPHIGHO2_02_FULL_49_9]OGW89902.1 MAG: hypothetical protein A3A73_01365 [Omnitrophica bacterium RIFCSPLOWO2_01_FULL_50_24]